MPFRIASQWSDGEYTLANNHQDDLAIITTQNGFSFRADDHVGTTTSTADPLTVTASSNASGSGIIERNTDLDFFSFSIVTAGRVVLNVNPAARGPNLDILAELYNSAGALLQSSNPVQEINATIDLMLAAGTYMLRIDGVGAGDPATTGYSDYGSLGFYSVSATASSGASFRAASSYLSAVTATLSMDYGYSTPDYENLWLADTSSMNRSFDEYRNHGRGRGPQNSYQTMPARSPNAGGSLAFVGPEPSVTPGLWLEEELEFHRQRHGVDTQSHGYEADDAVDSAIYQLVSEKGLADGHARELVWEWVDRPLRALDKGKPGSTRGGAWGLTRAQDDAVGATGISILDPPAEGRTPSSRVSIMYPNGQGADTIAFHAMVRRPRKAPSMSVRRFF